MLIDASLRTEIINFFKLNSLQ